MKLLALGLLVALLLHFPHLGAFVVQVAAVLPILALHAAGWALGQGWLLTLALAVVLWHLAARRWGWAR